MSLRRMAWVRRWKEFLGQLGSVERESVRREFNLSGAKQEMAEYLMFVHSGGDIVLPMPSYSDGYIRRA